MSETTSAGGFAGDPAATLAVASGTSACCGNPATNVVLAEPADPAGAPCCGTTAEAQVAGSCCGTAAKADAVASGAGCCG